MLLYYIKQHTVEAEENEDYAQDLLKLMKETMTDHMCLVLDTMQRNEEEYKEKTVPIKEHDPTMLFINLDYNNSKIPAPLGLVNLVKGEMDKCFKAK